MNFLSIFLVMNFVLMNDWSLLKFSCTCDDDKHSECLQTLSEKTYIMTKRGKMFNKSGDQIWRTVCIFWHLVNRCKHEKCFLGGSGPSQHFHETFKVTNPQKSRKTERWRFTPTTNLQIIQESLVSALKRMVWVWCRLHPASLSLAGVRNVIFIPVTDSLDSCHCGTAGWICGAPPLFTSTFLYVIKFYISNGFGWCSFSISGYLYQTDYKPHFIETF